MDPTANADEFPGTSRFRPLALLGRGSMGVVHRVFDTETETEVALKTFRTHTAEQLYYLKREFRALSDVVHPNLVELFELVVEADLSFFTMEYVDGSDFVAHVRDGAASSLDTDGALQRFLVAAPQVVRGLMAVHGAGRLHRDVKPSNVLVARDGRVVLLDFGLATALDVEGPRHYALAAAGTFAYMAPEVLWGQPPTPAADWYSAGVMFYEALTGQLPFNERAVVLNRRSVAAPSVRALNARVAESLAALIGGLLDREPARRPPARDILQQLQITTGGVKPRRGDDASSPRMNIPFVGRARELATLHAAFDDVQHGRIAVIHVSGPSGIGKSELVRRFLLSVEAADAALVLRGRCHPQEAVPYKALDRLIDGLSRFLVSMPASQIASLVPRHALALTRLFPVLESVPALAGAEHGADAVEPHEIRRRGFGALRELLAGVARQQPLILWIDDLQWTDLDSAVLLRELLRPPEAPVMLLVLSYRSEEPGTIPLPDAPEGEAAALPHEVIHEVKLGPLATEETRELAWQLCAAQIESDRRVAEIVAESAGSPFFISELARAARSGSPAARSLIDVMTERVRQLPAVARDVLEVVSIAGGPLQRSVVLRAAGIGERGRPVVSTLEHRYLVRTTSVSDEVAVEIYHDRIREALVGQLAPERRRTLHLQIAETLRLRPGADPYALFTHYLGAGDTGQAGQYAGVAADAAAEALAFDRAAQLYRQALELGGDPEEPQLLAKLAEALANAGRGHEAAERFEAAARALTARRPDARQVLTLRRRAAEQYLRVGRLDLGIAAARAVLAEVGVPFPTTPRRALASAVWQRARLAYHRWRAAPVVREEISPEASLRLDACWATAMTLTPMDQLGSDALCMRHLIDALACGARPHLIRGFSVELTKRAQLGWPWDRGNARMLAEIEALIPGSSDPYDHAWRHFAHGCPAYEQAAWRTAHEECLAGAAMLRARCTGVTWEVVTFEAFALSALGHMGELGILAQRLPEALADADARGDAYAAIGFAAGVLNLIWLAQDRPQHARQLIDEALARWPLAESFHIQHYLHLIAAVHIDLYLGDGWAAWRRMVEAWPGLRRAMFVAMEGTGVELHNLRARAALAAACAGPDAAGTPDPRWPRPRLLRAAAKDAAWLARRRPASARPFATLIRAGIAAAQGDTANAVARFAEAAAAFDAVEMKLYAAAARYREGTLRGGEEGERLQQQAMQWMHTQGVQKPAAMAAIFSPAPGS